MFEYLRRNQRRLALTVLASLLAACGVKTNPYPAADILPQKVRQLTQTVTEEGELILRWLPPETNMMGQPLKFLGGFQIEMADQLADAHYCLDCPVRYQPEPVDRPPALTPPPGRDLAPGPYEWRRRLEPGHVYHFRVTPFHKNGGIHPQAKTETTVWPVAPPEILRLKAALGDRLVELGWPPPPSDLTVEIEKRSAGEPWRSLPDLNPAAGRHLDSDLAHDRTYEYRGRFLKIKGETRVQGPWSRALKILVVDLTPPPPPAYLDAALAGDGIRLAWESLGQEAAGYLVYRQRSGEPEPRALTPAPLRANIFTDPLTPASGERVRYQVTAVDAKGNESRPSPVADVYGEGAASGGPLADQPRQAQPNP